MGHNKMKVYDHISDQFAQWILAQPVFFNATAPLSGEGHVNLSPRGLDSLRILDPRQVTILDRTGSGNETAAHLAQNARITLMFCAFEGSPRILRIYGAGEVISPAHPSWDTSRAHFAPELPGVRQIFRIAVSRLQTSCGFGVPLMAFQQQRDELNRWAENKGEDAIRQDHREKNQLSIDGLPAPG